MISLEDVRKIDLRIAQVLAAERMPGTDRLLKLTLDLGDERRVVVGGLARSYTPESLEGRQVVMVANLAPARIRGVESQGMILGVGCENAESVALLTVNRPVANGASAV